MRITILGCGGSAGVPVIGYGWGNCDPKNPKNRRLRSSVFIETEKTNILIDTSPDLRQQLLNHNISHVDAILYTHAHSDHLHGIDELRAVNRKMKSPIDLFANQETLDEIQSRFSYIFDNPITDKKQIFKPWFNVAVAENHFYYKDVEILSFDQDHGYNQTTLGYRIGNFAYSTDVVHMPEEAFDILKGVDTWVVDCIRREKHPTHSWLAQTLEWIDIVKPKKAILHHMDNMLDYETLKAELPSYIEPAYDGMVLEVF